MTRILKTYLKGAEYDH